MPNAHQLALRDPAMAAAMGLINSSAFGFEPAFHSDPNAQVNGCFAPGDESDDDYGGEFGADFGTQFGTQFGTSFGADFGTTFGAVAHVAKPTEAQAMALWNHHHMKKAHTARRLAVINPNEGSEEKIERYEMQVSETFVFGTPKTFTDLTVRPTVNFRPQVGTANAPTPMFAFISSILVANVNTYVGQGESDAYEYNANGWGKQLDMPTLTPAIPFSVNARYTGFTPPGFVAGTTNTFSFSVKGPASIVA